METGAQIVSSNHDINASGLSSANGASAIHNNALPDMVLRKVFSYLDFDDLVSVSSVCRFWNSALQFPGLWDKVVYKIPKTATANDVERILNNYRFLCNIKLEDTVNDPKELLETVVVMCDDLRSLAVGRKGAAYIDTIISAFVNFPKLQELKIDGLFVSGLETQKLVDKLGSLEYLKKLEISGNCLCNFPLKPIADGCPQMFHLNLKVVPRSTDELAYLLNQKKNQILSLHIMSSHLRTNSPVPLELCTKLENFTCDFHTPKCLIEERTDKKYPELKALRLARLRHPSISNNLSKYFHDKPSSNLVELNLSGCEFMSDDLADDIVTRCPLIRKLVLNSCWNFSCSWIIKVLKLPRLEHVEFDNFNYDEEWFVHLLQCKNLRHLNLRSCSGLDDWHAVELLDLVNLEYLNLSECVDLSNHFLVEFPRNVKLIQLEILKCRFDCENVEYFKRLYPFIKINFSQWSKKRKRL